MGKIIQSVPIETFIWQRESGEQDKIAYFDPQGTYLERAISRSAIDSALHIFSGPAKAVRRSSGGLVYAEPLQIVVCDGAGGNGESPLQIRVRFKDLRNDLNSPRPGPECQSYTKLVSAPELYEPFPYDFEGVRKQTFALDFGKGIVPVFVFHYHEEAGEEPTAFFLDAEDTNRALRAFKGNEVWVQPYRVARAALRWTGAAGQVPGASPIAPEAERARQNYEALKRAGIESLVPAALAAGEPVLLRGGASPHDIRRYLKIRILRQLRGSRGLSAVSREDEEDLLALGFSLG